MCHHKTTSCAPQHWKLCHSYVELFVTAWFDPTCLYFLPLKIMSSKSYYLCRDTNYMCYKLSKNAHCSRKYNALKFIPTLSLTCFNLILVINVQITLFVSEVDVSCSLSSGHDVLLSQLELKKTFRLQICSPLISQPFIRNYKLHYANMKKQKTKTEIMWNIC